MSQKQVGDPPSDDGNWGEWVAVVDDVLDTAIDREEVIECVCEDLRVDVPIHMDSRSERARWEFDGKVKIRVEGRRGALAEWLRWWYRKLPSGTGGKGNEE